MSLWKAQEQGKAAVTSFIAAGFDTAQVAEMAGLARSTITQLALHPEQFADATHYALAYAWTQISGTPAAAAVIDPIWPKLEKEAHTLHDVAARIDAIADNGAHRLVVPGLRDAALRLHKIAESLLP